MEVTKGLIYKGLKTYPLPLTRGARGVNSPATEDSKIIWVSVLSRAALSGLVILDAQVGDLILAPQIAQRVLQLGKLDEQIVLRVEE